MKNIYKKNYIFILILNIIIFINHLYKQNKKINYYNYYYFSVIDFFLAF